jgi:hypothetical protein
MQFSAAPGADFKSMNDPNQPDAIVQVASSTTVGQTLAFKVSGEGVLQAHVEGGAQGESASSQGGDRPGGGLGPPIDAPDPLQKYRWPILGGFAVLLVAGAVYIASRQQAAARAGTRAKSLKIEEQDIEYDPRDTASEREIGSQPATRRSSSTLLDAIKEELFQLEVERQKGQITQQEYEKTKAAIDQTLEHALKREAAKQA